MVHKAYLTTLGVSLIAISGTWGSASTGSFDSREHQAKALQHEVADLMRESAWLKSVHISLREEGNQLFAMDQTFSKEFADHKELKEEHEKDTLNFHRVMQNNLENCGGMVHVTNDPSESCYESLQRLLAWLEQLDQRGRVIKRKSEEFVERLAQLTLAVAVWKEKVKSHNATYVDFTKRSEALLARGKSIVKVLKREASCPRLVDIEALWSCLQKVLEAPSEPNKIQKRTYGGPLSVLVEP